MKTLEKQTRIVSIGLAVFLQCAPVARVIQAAPSLAAPAAYVLKFVALVASTLGAIQAVSGASAVLITSPTNSVGTNGTAYRYRITENSPSADPGVWYNALPLAPGLVINTNTGIITGTPAQTGTFVMNLTAGYLNLRAIPTNMVLTVYGKPVINTQPAGTNVNAGQNATFAVAVTALPQPTYYWRFNGAVISNGPNSSLTLSNVSAAQAGSYTVVASNFLGSVTSSVASLTVASGTPVTFTLQPQSKTGIAGSNVTLSAAVAGASPISFQWMKNSSIVPGATSSNLTVGPLADSNAGLYFLIASNSVGAVNSSTATLSVVHIPSVASVHRASSSTRLQFSREAGASYGILTATSIVGSAWLPLTNYPPVSVTTPTVFTNTATGAPAQFYRIQMTVP